VVAGLAAGFLVQSRGTGLDGWLSRLRARFGGPVAAPAAPAPQPAPAPAPAQPEAAAPAPAPGVAVPAPAPAAAPPAAPEPPAKAAAPAAPEPPAKAAKPAAPEPEARPAKGGRGAKAEAAVPVTAAARVRALAKGDLDLAVKQGRRLVAGLPPEHCALRLEIACKAGTIQHLMSLFKDQDPDVYLLPITLRDGRACYQVLYGNFPNLKAAQKAIGRLPKALHAERDEPKVFRIADLANM
jgi:septal ring-binding cell division protein DamX